MPTVTELQGLDPRKPWTLAVDIEWVQRNMIYSTRNLNAGRWWTRFTYAFIHLNETHLMNNLQMLIPSSISVQRAFGNLGLWFTFFGGCVVGSLDIAKTKSTQQRNALSSSILPGLQSWAAGNESNLFSSAIKKGVELSTDILSPIMSYLTDYVGCSTGCCALLGVDLCLSAEAVLNMFRRPKYERPTDEVALQMSSHIISTYFSLNMIAQEIRLFYEGGADGLDHAGHLLGLGFGVGAFLLMRLLHKREKL
eukprot:CAMPEP_0171514246 /NCGR_PEP_ID=MMETSP0959-20130129/2727_1 /TAXON_ID=87120 /ORGANISM="Aurantiochytrium limacinum, Strain ATCCMYA-1381" /LENGTH=251 /DNA_ID=CAMNT_0012052529 /DNA_START=58 /DNA_END=813 /DNA_ORIENTATION=+